jgi:curved DNA-binding protein CbpA
VLPDKRGIDVIKDELAEAYRTLGIPADSALSDIKLSEINRIYRKLAKRFHPDSNTGNPEYSHETIVRINKAYELIKASFKGGLGLSSSRSFTVKRSGAGTGAKQGYSEYDILKAKFRDQQRRAKDREKKEREALQRIIEKTVIERKHEIIDEKSFETIRETAFELISCYFDKNFNNTVFRNLPQTERRFNKYIEIYIRQLDELKSLAASFRSKLHSDRAKSACKFLRNFIDDVLAGCPVYIDRRAHAYQEFRKAAGNYEKFLMYFYSGRNISWDGSLQELKNALDSIENFLQSFPESPLTRYAEKKIFILDSLYRAFIKKV